MMERYLLHIMERSPISVMENVHKLFSGKGSGRSGGYGNGRGFGTGDGIKPVSQVSFIKTVFTVNARPDPDSGVQKFCFDIREIQREIMDKTIRG